MLILEMHGGFLCDFVHAQLLELILCVLSFCWILSLSLLIIVFKSCLEVAC